MVGTGSGAEDVNLLGAKLGTIGGDRDGCNDVGGGGEIGEGSGVVVPSVGWRAPSNCESCVGDSSLGL